MRSGFRSLARDYREHLRTAVEAVLFMAEAVLGFAAVRAVAFGGFTTRFAHAPRQAALWGSSHFLSVGAP